MSASDSLTAQRVHDLVMANRTIRAPEYRTERLGRPMTTTERPP